MSSARVSLAGVCTEDFRAVIPRVQNSGSGFLCSRRALEAIFASTSEEEKELFFGGNARRVYRTT